MRRGPLRVYRQADRDVQLPLPRLPEGNGRRLCAGRSKELGVRHLTLDLCQTLSTKTQKEVNENQDELSPEALASWPKELGLDDEKLQEALERPEIAKRIKEDRMSGIRSGVNGTPTFFINGTRYDGSPDYESLVAALEEQRIEAKG